MSTVLLFSVVNPLKNLLSGIFLIRVTVPVPLVKSIFQMPHDPVFAPPEKPYCPATTAKTSGPICVIAAEHVASVKVASFEAVFFAGSTVHISPLSKNDTISWPFERAAMPSAEVGEENL